jgi:hypothetical protein
MRSLKDPPINSSEFCLDNLLWFIRSLGPRDLETYLRKHNFIEAITDLMKD